MDISVEDIFSWSHKSTKGEVCGMFMCHESPTSQCPICKCWYCYDHLKLHFHQKPVHIIPDDGHGGIKLDEGEDIHIV